MSEKPTEKTQENNVGNEKEECAVELTDILKLRGQKAQLAQDLAIPVLGIYPREPKTRSHRNSGVVQSRQKGDPSQMPPADEQIINCARATRWNIIQP